MKEKKKLMIAIVLIILLVILVFAIVKSNSGKTFTVSFNTHGGTEMKTLKIKDGETIEEPEEPSKEGYEFIGWYYDGKKFDFATKLTKNVELEAKWLKVGSIKHTVTFDSTGGSSVSEQKIKTGEKVKEPDNPVRNGYTFLCWTLDGKTYDFNQKIEKGITLVATWKKNEPAKVIPSTNSNPTVKKPVVVKPVVKTKIYKVSFYDGNKIISTKEIAEGKLVDAPILEKENFILVGWKYTGGMYDFTKPVTSDIRLEAIWNPILESVSKIDPDQVPADGEENQKAFDVIKKNNLVTIMKNNTFVSYTRGVNVGNWVAISLDLGVDPTMLEVETSADSVLEIEPISADETSFIAWIDIKDDMESEDYTFKLGDTETVGTVTIAVDYLKLKMNGANKLLSTSDNTDLDYNNQSVEIATNENVITVTETRFFQNTTDNTTVGEYAIVLDLGINPSQLRIQNATIDVTEESKEKYQLTGTQFILKLSNNNDPKVGKTETFLFKNGLDENNTLEITVEFVPLTNYGLAYEAEGEVAITTPDVDIKYYADRQTFIILSDIESFTFTDTKVDGTVLSKSATNTSGVWVII